MEILYYTLLVFMLTAYVVLDGFDLGAGIIHLIAGRKDSERRTILNAIGPLWDGNEVWLIGAGGLLFFAFPVLYAASFSGFYLPLMMVLWLLMLRALAIEFRRHIENDLWQSLWDAVFSISSLGLAFLLGTALGNVLRGVNLDSSGFFFEPLWTDFRVSADSGIVDWYTILLGCVAVVGLALHGSLFIAYRTDGELNDRCRKLAFRLWPVVIVLSSLALAATCWIRPDYLKNYFEHPWMLLLPALTGCGMICAMILSRKKKDGFAFLSSCLFISSAGASTAFALFPILLAASGDSANSLTVFNAHSGNYGLDIGRYWLGIGLPLIILYFCFLYYTFRGKISSQHREHY